MKQTNCSHLIGLLWVVCCQRPRFYSCRELAFLEWITQSTSCVLNTRQFPCVADKLAFNPRKENVLKTDGKMMNLNPGGPLCKPSSFAELPSFLLMVSYVSPTAKYQLHQKEVSAGFGWVN